MERAVHGISFSGPQLWGMEPVVRFVTGILLACLFAVGGDRATWQIIPTLASAQDNNTLMRLVADAFMQAKGIAPGSPGFPWDRVQYSVIKGDFSTLVGDEVAVAGTLLPEDGFIVLYGTDGASYKAIAKWDGLACVEKLRATRIAPPTTPGGPSDIAVLHSYDEMIGALFRWQRLLYLRYSNGRLQPLLELVTLDEAYSVAPPYAEKAQLQEEVVIEKPGWLETLWEVRHWDRMSDGEYKLRESRNARTVFQWDPVANRLAPVAGSKRP